VAGLEFLKKNVNRGAVALIRTVVESNGASEKPMVSAATVNCSLININCH